jgi:predicted ATPase/DNA-binding XRE family transcriptional regulator
MDGNRPFGEWLRQRRKSLDLTQEQLADRVSCSPDMIRKIEGGVRRPSRQVAELLADLLRVPADERDTFKNFARGIGASVRSPEIAYDRRSLSNVPAPITRLIGREAAVAEIADRLLQDGIRLLTLTGPPGIGKTSLATQVGWQLLARFPDGVFFVPLAPTADPASVPATIAHTLGLLDQGDRPVLETLAKRLNDKQTLLLLDNFEQVVEAAPAVSYLLERCPQLSVLVTSRAALHVRGERQFPVPSLDLPDLQALPSTELLARNPAVALFVERAQAVKPGFVLTEDNAPAVATICVHLDGLPLAIELAAARVRLLSPHEIQARLDSRLTLLTGGPRDLPARQQTLRGAIDWSYRLLDNQEQILFARLGVFVGGCTFSAAEATCNAQGDLGVHLLDRIESLLDKSLLRQEPDAGGESRYTMLEMVREYALGRLEDAGRTDEIRRLHAEYFLALAEAADAQLRGPDHALWLERLDREHDNLRAALSWTEQVGEIELGLRLAGALGWFWELRGYVVEGRARLTSLLSREEAQKRTAARAKALNAAGRLAQWGPGLARPLLEESLEIAREIGDKWLALVALHNLGNVAQTQGDIAAARHFHEESLATARETNEKWGIAWGLMGVGHVALDEGDYPAARRAFEESLAVRTQMNDKWGIARSLNELGDVARLQGDYIAARSFYEKSIHIHRELGHKGFMDHGLSGLANVELHLGDYERTVELFGEALHLFRELGNEAGIGLCLAGLGAAAYKKGQADCAARLFGAASAILQMTDYHMVRLERAELEGPMSSVSADSTLVDAWQEGQAMTLDEAVAYALEGDYLD